MHSIYWKASLPASQLRVCVFAGTVVRYGGCGTAGTSARTHCTVPTLLTEKPKTQIPDDMTMIEVTMRVGSTIAVLGLAACHFRNL